jgi:hypothetical protein
MSAFFAGGLLERVDDKVQSLTASDLPEEAAQALGIAEPTPVAGGRLPARGC